MSAANETSHLDGYRAELTQADDGQWVLNMNLISNGQVQVYGSHELTRRPSTITEMAGAMRDYALIDALCRYMNAGGTLDELDECYRSCIGKLPERLVASECQLVFAAQQATHSRIFDIGGKYLRVVEDEYSEELTEKQLAEFLDIAAPRPTPEKATDDTDRPSVQTEGQVVS